MSHFDRIECEVCHHFIGENTMHQHMRSHGERGEHPRPLPDGTGQNYVASRLPCGREVNQGRQDECCRVVCPEKGFAEIEECYARKRAGR